MHGCCCSSRFLKFPGRPFLFLAGLLSLFFLFSGSADARLDQPHGPLKWVSWRNMSKASYEQKLETYKQKGYRPIDVEILGGVKRTYGLVMRKDRVNPRWGIHTRLNDSQFHAKWDDYRKKGYRPIDLESYRLNGRQYYAGIWIKDGESSWASFRNLSSAQFHAKYDHYRKKGYLPIDVDGYVKGGHLKFLGIFVKNRENVGWSIRRNVKQRDFGRHFQDMSRKGFRLYDTNSYRFKGQQLYAVIWVKDNSNRRWAARRDMGSTSFHNYWASFRDQGYRLEDLEVYRTKNGLRYAGVWLENHPERLGWNHRNTVTNLVNTYLSNNPSMGFSLAIYQNGAFRYLRGWGLADQKAGEQAHARTVYRYASVSKAVTGVLGYVLEKKNKLDLSDGIRTILPDLPDHHGYDLDDLLAIRSGVCHYKDCGKFDGTNINLNSSSGMWRGVKKFMDEPLATTTGDLLYSTHGYTIAAAAYEKETGRSFNRLLDTYINNPLGIDIHCENLKKADSERSNVYFLDTSDNKVKPATAANIRWKCGGGGMEGTVYDLAKFGVALEQNTLLSNAEKTAMITAPDNQRRGGNLYADGWAVNSSGTGNTINWYAKAGDQTGGRTYLRVYPATNLVIALAGNTRGSGYQTLVNDIAAAIGP